MLYKNTYLNLFELYYFSRQFTLNIIKFDVKNFVTNKIIYNKINFFKGVKIESVAC